MEPAAGASMAVKKMGRPLPSLTEMGKQWVANRYKCIPRNTDLLISAQGQYLYCFNDIRHGHPLGDVRDIGIREALRRREREGIDSAICAGCGMQGRYRLGELSRAFLGWMSARSDSGASAGRRG